MCMADTTRPFAGKEGVLKRCSVCGQELPLSDFSSHKGHKDGLASRCRTCNASSAREWYQRKQWETSRLYSTYVAMKQRCHCSKHDSFPAYGGRGIAVCSAWRKSFEDFRDWAMQNGYQPGLQIDRIDDSKGYSPDNCRFVSVVQNQHNKRKRVRPVRTNPKLSPDEVRTARRLLKEGVSQRAIGRHLGVTHGTIGAIKLGRTWTDIH